MLLLFIILFSTLIHCTEANEEDDRVSSLPGLLFDINYKLYSGYLNANVNGTWKMHYWLIESKSSPENDPLLVWFQGGPGCSSFGGAFEELGPFYINFDAQTLYENKYSWNAKANVLFLESPIGVGFSYDTTNPDFSSANDDQSASQNYQALQYFFNSAQPKYANRTFFLSGESYAGVYIPMLTALLTEGINNGTFPNTAFQGSAIGNGFMNAQTQYNSQVIWSAYHAKVSLNDWNTLKSECGMGATKFDVDNYNFLQYLNTTNNIDYVSDGSKCGDLVFNAITMPDVMDQYNYYQDCWNQDFWMSAEKRKDEKEEFISHPALRHRIRRSVNSNQYVNTAALTNYDSTDNQLGYPCWNGIKVRKYANIPEVQKALHIDEAWKNGVNGTQRKWHMCNNPMYDNYVVTYPNQQRFFDYVLKNTKNPNFRFLIYNGDADTVCNYLGDSWFMQKVATDNGFMTNSTRDRWMYRQQTAGFVQTYTRVQDKVTLDIVTVKGAGHMVPNDRPSASVQMITNFMLPRKDGTQTPDYNSTLNIDPTPALAQFVTTTTPKNSSSYQTNILIALLIVLSLYL